MVEVSVERRGLLAQLHQLAEPAYGEGLDKVAPTARRVLGVRVPQIRETARRWQQAHEAIPWPDLLALLERLWYGESREEQLLAVELIRRYPRRLLQLPWELFDRWREEVDNWPVADSLGAYVLGPWLLHEPNARTDHLWELIEAKGDWSRRLALVATIRLNRHDDRFADLTLALVDEVKGERPPMITKAVSWALRAMIKRHRMRVSTYVEENRELLAAHVVREVDHKLRTP